jgi:hypothetical protein
MASNANALGEVFSSLAQEDSVHLDAATVPDCHVTAEDDAHHADTKVSHGCCFSFVGIVPDSTLVQTTQTAVGLIPFNPSLSLALRIEGLYRPPRQNS